MHAIVTYSNALANLLQCFPIWESRSKTRMGWSSTARVSLSNSNLLLVLIFISSYPLFHGIIFIFLKLWTIQISGHKMLRCLCFKNPCAGSHDIFSPLGCLRASLHESLQKQMYAWYQFFKAWTKPWQIICVIFQSEAVLAQASWPCYVREVLLSPATEAMWKQSDHNVEQYIASHHLRK